jgi:FHS family L-fucose permease-like MFS transporter
MKKNISVDVATINKADATRSILIIAMLFFVFGFVTWINAILIPYFKFACELNNFEAYLVAFAFYISYLIMSLPAAYLLKKVGFKNGMMIGFFIMSLGAFVFVPAAYFRSYATFLAGLFTLGAGLAILQTAANPYVTILGPKELAAKRFSIMGICNKFAGIIAPLLLAAVILKKNDKQFFAEITLMNGANRALALDELILRVIEPYVVVGVVLVALGFLVKFSPLPEINTDIEPEDVALSNAGKKHILHFPHLVLGAFAIFFHVGSQVIAVDTIINYANSMGISLTEAKIFPSYTLTATIIGYLLGISFIPKLITQLTALRICTFLGIILTFLIIYSNIPVSFLGHKANLSIWFVTLLGFANSMIWAGIWPLALDGLGKFIKTGASLLIMGLCGNAILPLFYGHFADLYNMRTAYWVLLPCYLYLSFYAWYGFKIKKWSFKKSDGDENEQ